MEGPVVVPATSSGARRRRASETPEEIASKSLVALVILMPVTVLATSAIILWRPFLCAWFKFFRVSPYPHHLR